MGNDENTTNNDSETRFRASGREAIIENVALAFEKARHHISIFSPILDSNYFNTTRVSDALAKLCTGGRPNRVRILVQRGDETIRNNGRITSLAQRLSDFVELKQLEQGVGTFSEMFIVIDRAGYLRQPDSEKPECLVDFGTGHDLGALSRQFDKLWERSERIPGLNVLGLGR
ncbi:MAG: hypothetical protein AMJ68_09640 [Acidithiobacillales bacterium SG8_45]|jgi:hypothetical protein|nr:MAG: hypothetical protein AMJ68_09640 [Acidithiobacillales bacterium SG8_45]